MASALADNIAGGIYSCTWFEEAGSGRSICYLYTSLVMSNVCFGQIWREVDYLGEILATVALPLGHKETMPWGERGRGAGWFKRR